MSDKLEKCVCGVGLPFLEEVDISTAPPDVNDEVIKYYMECTWCSCSTSYCNTKSHAKEEWQTIQRALKSGWSSGVPTEEGHYFFAETGASAPCYVSVEYINGTLCYVFDGNPESTWTKEMVENMDIEKNWLRINYPDPPKD